MTSNNSAMNKERSVGAMLREGREALGLSFADMAEITRIQPMWLHCLEQERFDEMPAEVFIRGFLKSYARELRLDEAEVFQTYLRQTAQNQASSSVPVELDDDAPQRLAVARLASPSTGARYAYGAAVAMLVALLAVAVLAMSSGGEPDSAASNFRSNDTTEAWQPALDSSADWRRR